MIEHEGCKKRKGERTDIKDFQAAIMAGKTATQLWEGYGKQMDRMPRLYKAMRSIASNADLVEAKWPIEMPWGMLEEPHPANKQRHIWFWGPASLGKSLAVERVLAPLRNAFKVGDTESKFEELTGYADQDIILYDDIRPCRAEIINVTNTHLMMTTVYGKSRNYPTHWKKNHTRTVIVLTNDRPRLDEAEQARFQVIEAAPYMEIWNARI